MGIRDPRVLATVREFIDETKMAPDNQGRLVRTSRTVFVSICLAAISCGSVDEGEQELELRSGSVEKKQHASIVPGKRILLRFKQPVQSRTLKSLERSGVRVHRVVGSQGAIATVGETHPETLDAVDWVTEFLPEHKLSPEIQRWGLERRTPVVVELDLFPGSDPEELKDELKQDGLRVLGSGSTGRGGRLTAQLMAGSLESLLTTIATSDAVAWVGVRGKRVLHNDSSAWVGQSGLDGGQAMPLYDKGLFGQGQIGAVLDTGLDVDHCFFHDAAGTPATNVGWSGRDVDASHRKVVAYNFIYQSDNSASPTDWDNHGHGTHVAGTVVGDGGTLGSHDGSDGMAPAAQLVMQDGGYTTGDACSDLAGLGCAVVDLKPIFQQAYDRGARVHNNSWGDREDQSDQNTYSQGCVDVDEFMWNHRDFLLVFSAGNFGPDGASAISPGVAKNCLSVAATQRGDEADKLASFSSRGPAHDGRIKPDVSFPGFNVVSAANDGDIGTNNCGMASLSGTSMSAPGAAGMALLARQYFVDGFYPTGEGTPSDGFAPSAPLLKATLINSSVPMDESAIPSMDQGWGRVQLNKTLSFVDSSFGLLALDEEPGGGFADADELPVERSFMVSPGAAFKATLVWTDYPSNPAANSNLVNNLDLVVEVDGTEYLGNVFSDGLSTVGGAADELNNVEQVWLEDAPEGTYTVRVAPKQIAMGPQPFALVVTGNFESGGDVDGTGGTSGTGGTAGVGGTDASGGNDAGTGGVSSVGGTGAGTSMDSETMSEGDAARGSDEGGCSCRSAPARKANWWLALLAPVVLIGASRRKSTFK